MKVYLVGGAVRDKLMGRPVIERDWVVIGSTPEEMLQKGFRPVGKDFPVFLHPKSNEEYALARTERKVAPGYKGFTFHADPSVTLEEDLIRRDLTINAMAQDEAGNIIDPFQGQRDLQAKILRHVSPAFKEDPVRILRIARFAARFADFSIAPETLELMQGMVKAGEVNALVPERVWQECLKALSEKAPQRFFQVLQNCQALSIIFPDIADLESCLKYLEQAVNLTSSPAERLAAFTFPISNLKEFWQRLKAPTEFSDLSLSTQHYAEKIEQLSLNDTGAILDLFEKADAYRRIERFQLLLFVSQICFNSINNEKIEYLLKLVDNTKKIPQDFLQQADKKNIKEAIHQYRFDILESITKS